MTKCNEETERPRGIKGSDAIIEHDEAYYRDREHWSEKHGWSF